MAAELMTAQPGRAERVHAQARIEARIEALAERVWQGGSDTWQWLRGVVLGEWADERTLSQIVTDALAGFVPGLGSLITLRDLVAVIVRLAKRPDKREDVNEWILLVAMLLPLVATLAGALFAGIGALVGAEAGAFVRAVALFLVKKGGVALKALVEFFQAHGYGDVVQALRQIHFARYKDALLQGLGDQLDKLVHLTRALQARLRALNPEALPHWLPGRARLLRAIDHCDEFIGQLEALRQHALSMIPKALIELDQRLGALLSGNLKAAVQATHTIEAGKDAPAVARLRGQRGEAVLRNAQAAEPGNTRRVAERRVVAVVGEREYKFVDETGRPVGAKPYKPGTTKLENPPQRLSDWDRVSAKVEEGWPDMAIEYKPGTISEDYATFSHYIRPSRVQAGSPTTFQRVVSHDKGAEMDHSAFWNRQLPVDGEDLRAGSAVKESWNLDGLGVQLTVPPIGHPVWKELHSLQEKAAGRPVPYAEELKFWEGPAASQTYEKKLPGIGKVQDDWYLPGGKQQQFFDRAQMKVLYGHGFITERTPTAFTDFDPVAGSIVPKDGPFLEIVPISEAVPPPARTPH